MITIPYPGSREPDPLSVIYLYLYYLTNSNYLRSLICIVKDHYHMPEYRFSNKLNISSCHSK